MEAEVCADHIHMLEEIPPKIAVSGFMGYLNGKSGTMLYGQFDELKYKYRSSACGTEQDGAVPLAQQGVEAAAARLGVAHAHLVQPVFHIGQGIGQVHTHLWNLVQHAAPGCQPVLHALNFSIELFMNGSVPLFLQVPSYSANAVPALEQK